MKRRKRPREYPIMRTKNPDIHSMDAVLDNLYGKSGTPPTRGIPQRGLCLLRTNQNPYPPPAALRPAARPRTTSPGAARHPRRRAHRPLLSPAAGAAHCPLLQPHGHGGGQASAGHPAGAGLQRHRYLLARAWLPRPRRRGRARGQRHRPADGRAHPLPLQRAGATALAAVHAAVRRAAGGHTGRGPALLYLLYYPVPADGRLRPSTASPSLSSTAPTPTGTTWTAPCSTCGTSPAWAGCPSPWCTA